MGVNSAFSDEELLAGVRLGDSAALSQLAEKYSPLISSLVVRYLVPGVTDGELRAEALTSLDRAARTYETGRGTRFGLYAKMCMSRALRRYADTARKQAHAELSEADGIITPSAESGLISRETGDETMRNIRALLSDYEYSVLLLHMQGYSTDEISARLSRDKKSVDNAKARIFRRLRENRDMFPV